METSSLDQILIYPFFSEITPTLERISPLPPSAPLGALPLRFIKKSVGEQNNEKGSTHLILIPHRRGEQHVLYSVDHTPVMSKSKIQKEMGDLVKSEEISLQ